MVHADDVNVLGERVYTIQKHAYVLLVTEVNTYNSNYMDISGDQDAGRSHIIKIDNSSFKGMEHFKYLGTTLRDQNSIP